jgi:O-antigen ligase
VHRRAKKISDTLLVVSYCGLALFVPFSISGANTAIMLGFVGVLVSIAAVPSARARFAAMKSDPLLGACVLLVVSALPSVVISDNKHRALRDWESYWLLLIYFYVAYGLWFPRVRRAVYLILFGSATLSCLVALVQYGGGLDVLFVHIREEPRPSSTLFIMTFAGILCQLVTVNFAVLFHRGRFSRLESLLTGGLVIQVIGLLLTHTRGAWLALVAGLGVATALIRKRACLLLVGGLAVVVVFFAVSDARIRDKIVSIPRTIHGPTDVNVSTRFVLWDVSWELIKHHPILGVGMGDFSTEAEKLVGDRHTETLTDAHNVYLQVLATRGLLGFLPFVYFWFVLLRSVWRTRFHARSRTDTSRVNFSVHFVNGVFAAAIALLVGALSENNIDDSEVFTAFMFLVGMAKSFSLYPEPIDTRPAREMTGDPADAARGGKPSVAGAGSSNASS